MLSKIAGALLVLAPIWLDVIQGPDGAMRIERPQRLEPIRIELAWDKNAEPDVVRYEVFRAVKVGVTTGTVFLDQALTARPYWYAVRAVDASENRSEFASWIRIAPP